MPSYENILINPHQRYIESISGLFDEYHEYLRCLIGGRIYTFVRLYENGDGVYIDDEGLYAPERHFWIHRNYPQPLVNIGVFVGVNDMGETVPASTALHQLQKDLCWIGDDHDMTVITTFGKNKIDMSNGYEDYRPIFFGE
jgi:hypothetical protein